jgi:hypothetical protein
VRTFLIAGHIVGLVMALYFLLCLTLIQRELKRKGREDQARGRFPVGE